MVMLVGDFNARDPATTPMKRYKGGTYSVILDLSRDGNPVQVPDRR
jgi:hypothetical protein